MEPGEPAMPLHEGSYALSWRSGYLTLEVWTDERNLLRRITGLAGQSRSRVELTIERFGKKTGTLTIQDASAPRVSDRSSRLSYRESFRRSLMRQFAGWRIGDLTAEADLEHSLSPSYPRALLRQGTKGWAAIGGGPDSDANGVLTFGLIWLDYLRSRERKLTIEGLALFLQRGRERTTSLRLQWMNPNAAQFQVFVQGDDGFEDRVDLADYGNLDTHLEPCTRLGAGLPGEVESWMEEIAAAVPVERRPRGDGGVSLCVHGLEFARATDRGLTFGIETERRASASNLKEIVSLATQLHRLRSTAGGDHLNPLYARNPERWLESCVRSELTAIDATLMSDPVYGQVPAFTAGDRDVIDLLAVDGRGRLCVMELKAAEDIHLPLQGLDYWTRVRRHAAAGDFSRCAYFPGVELRTDAPRMLLIAPALDFHPSNEVVLRYFAPQVEVERVGVGLEWRKSLKVMFRYSSGR